MSFESLSVRRNDGPSSSQRGERAEVEIVEVEPQHAERRGYALSRSSTGNMKGSKERLEENVSVVPVLMAKDGTHHHSSSAAAQQNTLRRHAHSFFSMEMADCRREYFKIVLRAAFLIIVLTWACLPIYWGSLASSAELTGNLSVWVIDRDQARIGIGLTNAAQAARTSGPGSLGWQVVAEADAGDDNAVMQAVLNEDVWMAVVVSENATLHLQNARARGDASYDPSGAISVYYAQARNEVASANFLVPLASAFLSNYTSTYASASVQRFIDAISSPDGSVNATALQLIAQAPQTLSPAIGFKMVNLRPYTAPVAQAVTLVGQIYIVIFAFIFVMAHSTARTFVEPFLTYRSYVRVRIFTPLVVYLPLSLSYAMISLPFKLPFDAKFSYAAGFFTFFAFIYMGMCALGLALEAMITLLTPRFVPFFLVLLIIVNISTAALPAELQDSFYQYGAGFQFLHIETAVRTIVFNTASRLGTNAGVLVFWSMLSAGTMALFTWWVRRRDRRRDRSRTTSKPKTMPKTKSKAPGSGAGGGSRSGSVKGVREGKERKDVGIADANRVLSVAGEKGVREKGARGKDVDVDVDGDLEMIERGWGWECERDRVDAAGVEEMGRPRVEEDEDEDEDEEENGSWKRANVDLGLAPVESRRSGAEVIAFQA